LGVVNRKRRAEMKRKSVGCRLLVPDGSLKDVVERLLAEAGFPISYSGQRSYKGVIGNARLFPPPYNVVTRMRPWDIPWVIADGKADLGFSADDLIGEAGCQRKVTVIDRYPLSRGGVGKTRLVIAVPPGSRIRKVADLKPQHELVTEYPRLARQWLKARGVRPRIRQCHGSLEGFDDFADAIFENVETGLSLEVAGFRVIAQVMESRCCLIAGQAAIKDASKSAIIDQVRLLLASVIDARQKRTLTCNVLTSLADINEVLRLLPGADSPTVSELANKRGVAVEAVVPAGDVPSLICQLKAAGATSVIVSPMSHWAK